MGVEPYSELGLDTGQKPYLGAELTFLLSIRTGTGRERGSQGSPARPGAHRGSEKGGLGRRRQCAAVPGWRGGSGAVLPPRLLSGLHGPRFQGVPTRVGWPAPRGREPGVSGLRARVSEGLRSPWPAPGHAPTLRSLSLVPVQRKEALGRRQKPHVARGGGRFSSAWPGH